MFTGIVTAVGTVRAVRPIGEADMRLEIATPWRTEEMAIGASVACAGCCLTVVARAADWFAAEVSAETLARTTLGGWAVGTRLNLERPLRLGDELGGHLVSGHIDGTAEIVSVVPDHGSRRWRFLAPPALAGFIAAKGSVALDGVSLTVNETEGAVFGVNLIAHTEAVTTFGARKVGERVNLEIDLLARYIARLHETGVVGR